MKLKDTFLSLIKGGITGISSLIPGISSGSILVSLGAYTDTVEGIGNIFKKNNRKIFLVAFPIFLGLLAGLFGGQRLVYYFLDNYKLQTIFLFIGLIAGGYRLVIRNINSKKKSTIYKNVGLFLLVFVLTIIIQVLVIENIGLKILFVKDSLVFGLLAGFILLIPGLSLTTNDVLRSNYGLLYGDLLNIFNLSSFLSIILFLIGAIISILVVSYIAYKILLRKPKFIMLITGAMLTASIVIAILQIDKFTPSFVNIFTTILAFLWGYILAKNLENE